MKHFQKLTGALLLGLSIETFAQGSVVGNGTSEQLYCLMDNGTILNIRGLDVIEIQQFNRNPDRAEAAGRIYQMSEIPDNSLLSICSFYGG